MSVVAELIREEGNGVISFGDYTQAAKQKKSGFEVGGDLYKVKTFKEITKLEKNELFVYESVPGTAVNQFKAMGGVVDFVVEGIDDTQITLELESETAYGVAIDGADVGVMTTNLGGKLVISVQLGDQPKHVTITKDV